MVDLLSDPRFELDCRKIDEIESDVGFLPLIWVFEEDDEEGNLTVECRGNLFTLPSSLLLKEELMFGGDEICCSPPLPSFSNNSGVHQRVKNS